ncbi:MAG: hypothetical protein WCS28_02830 [Thiomicrospira sp.]|jgi:hypothetical protein
MPGTNHQVETQLLNNLPLSLRAAAEDLLKHNTLKTLLLMRREGVSPFLHKTYPNVNDIEWIKIINYVILTKVSYFEINNQFSGRHLDKLLQIAQDAMDLPDPNPINLYRATEHRYPVFAKVIKDIITLRQQQLKRLLAQKNVQAAKNA